MESCGLAAERRQQADAAAERVRLLRLPGAFPARYAGTCVGCHERFDVGDPIVFDDDADGWRSLQCCEAAR